MSETQESSYLSNSPSSQVATAANQIKKARSDFNFLNVVGEGSFSTVHLVEEKKTGKKFASMEIDHISFRHDFI